MTDEAGPRTEHEGHYGNHEGYACGFSGPHCWACSEPWPCRASRGIEAEVAIPDSRLRVALEYGPEGVFFPNLPDQPTGPDVLEAIAYWMDRVDERDGNTKRGHDDVQKHLRKWAAKLRAALSPEGRQEPER